MNKFAFKNHEVHLFIFTDWANRDDFLPSKLVHKMYQERLGWPFDSLGRHYLYLENMSWFKDMDYLIAIDSDSLIVDYLDETMLGERIACLQAWTWGYPREEFSYDARLDHLGRPFSSAYIGKDDYWLKAKCYFCGGIVGGTFKGFREIIEKSVELSRLDLLKSPPRIALWHDESYLNKVFLDLPPTTALSPSFMYPEPPSDDWLYSDDNEYAYVWERDRFKPKIFNLGVRKHENHIVDFMQPLSVNLPAIMTPVIDGEKKNNFKLPVDMKAAATLVTFVVKAFERPNCLDRLIKSLGSKYPGFNLMILDDSYNKINLNDYPSHGMNVTYIQSEPDIGLSEGRNRLVDKVETPYLVLLDDDFIFDSDHLDPASLGDILNSLQSSVFDIAGGCVSSKYGEGWSYSFSKDIENKILFQKQDISCANHDKFSREPSYVTEKVACWETSTILNFFVGSVDFLRRTKWDPRLKVGEHEDFFLTVEKLGGKVGMCRGFTSYNDNTCNADSETYKKARKRVFDYWVIVFKKWDINKMITLAGSYTLQCNNDSDSSDCLRY